MKTLTKVLIIGLLIPVTTFGASGFIFSPVSSSYEQGDTFSVAIVADPQSAIYTAKVELKYPPEILEVKSFTFADGWLALVQPGYDLVDNAKGVLIKTAGYPSGLASKKTFGTAIFYAKKAGSATISIGNNSLVLDSNNTNVFNNVLTQGVFTVSFPAPQTITPSVSIQETVIMEEVGLSELASTQEAESEEIKSASEGSQSAKESSLMAKLIGFTTQFPISLALGIVIGFVIGVLMKRWEVIKE